MSLLGCRSYSGKQLGGGGLASGDIGICGDIVGTRSGVSARRFDSKLGSWFMIRSGVYERPRSGLGVIELVGSSSPFKLAISRFFIRGDLI